MRRLIEQKECTLHSVCVNIASLNHIDPHAHINKPWQPWLFLNPRVRKEWLLFFPKLHNDRFSEAEHKMTDD